MANTAKSSRWDAVSPAREPMGWLRVEMLERKMCAICKDATLLKELVFYLVNYGKSAKWNSQASFPTVPFYCIDSRVTWSKKILPKKKKRKKSWLSKTGKRIYGHLVLSKTSMLRKYLWVQITHNIYLYFWFPGLIHKTHYHGPNVLMDVLDRTKYDPISCKGQDWSPGLHGQLLLVLCAIPGGAQFEKHYDRQ